MVLRASEILRDAVRFRYITAYQRSLEFHNIIILRDTYIALDEGCINRIDTFGATVDEFLQPNEAL